MTQDNQKTFSEWMRILLTAFFARLRLLIIVPLLCAATTATLCYTLPKIYQGGFSILIKAPEFDKASLESTASIVVRPGDIQKNIISDEIFMLESYELYRSMAKALRSQQIQISGYWDQVLPGWLQSGLSKTKQSLEKVLVRLKIEKDSGKQRQGSKPDDLAKTLADISKVGQLVGSDVIQIQLTHHDREMIPIILEAYVEAYFTLRSKVWFNAGAPGFFNDRNNQSFEQWQEILDEIIAIKEKADLGAPGKEKEKLLELLVANTSEIHRLQMDYAELEHQANRLAQMEPMASIAFMTKETETDRFFRELKMRIGQIQFERSQLLREFDEKAPSIIKIDYHLNDLYDQYKRMVTHLVAMQMDRVSNRILALENSVQKGKTKLLDLTQHQHQVSALEQKAELFRQQYLVTGEKAMAIKLQEDLRKQMSTVNLVTAPYVEVPAIWPRKNLLIAIAFILGFLLTLFMTVVMQLMRDSFHLPEEVSRDLGLPVLASFPYRQ